MAADCISNPPPLLFPNLGVPPSRAPQRLCTQISLPTISAIQIFMTVISKNMGIRFMGCNGAATDEASPMGAVAE